LRAALQIGRSVFYLSDGHGTVQPSYQGISLSLALPSLVEAERVIQALSDGGRIVLPLRQTTWANIYGVVIDKFGLHWTVETNSIEQLS
jgi:PhnB protein